MIYKTPDGKLKYRGGLSKGSRFIWPYSSTKLAMAGIDGQLKASDPLLYVPTLVPIHANSVGYYTTVGYGTGIGYVISRYSCQFELDWSVIIVTPFGSIRKALVDNNGEVTVIGYFEINDDVLYSIYHYDSDGELTWTKTTSQVPGLVESSIVDSENNIYVCGGSIGSGVLYKISNTGVIIGTLNIDATFYDLRINQNDEIVAAQHNWRYVNLTGVHKLNTSLGTIWHNSDEPCGVCSIDDDGMVYAVTSADGLLGQYDLDGVLVWQKRPYQPGVINKLFSDLNYMYYGSTITTVWQNALARLVVSGVATGGTYTLKYNGQETGNINYDSDAATIKSSLEALSTIVDDSLFVLDTLNTGLYIEFGDTVISPYTLTIDITNLTGVTSASFSMDSRRGTNGLIKLNKSTGKYIEGVDSTGTTNIFKGASCKSPCFMR